MSYSLEEKIDSVVSWLRDQALKAGAKGLLVGVSGGIDSAVVACLIKKAFPDNSLGVILPCGGSRLEQECAYKVVSDCGIKFTEIDLSKTHGQLFDAVEEKLQEISPAGENRKMASANLKARLRMSTLYAIGNSLNYLVIGTDNAAETLTGYFTKYGDGGVDLIPLANLTKREVREWGRFLGVPEVVIDRAPTAGLWDNQTDEGEMGTTYEMIDDYLEGKPIPEHDRKIIERLHRQSAHKRCLPPVPPKI